MKFSAYGDILNDMDISTAYALSICGTIAFVMGIVLLLWELFTDGLSKKSLFSYLFLLCSIILLSQTVVFAALSCAGLSVLFLLLLLFYRRQRNMNRTVNEEEDER